MNNISPKWLFLGVLSLVWGSSFILIKKGLVALTSIQVGSLRIVFAALFLLLIGFGSLKKIPKNKWKYLAITAFVGTFLPAFLFAFAQKHISSAVGAVLNSLTPMITFLLGIFVFSMGFKKSQIWGVCIGLVGSSILILSGAVAHPEQNYWYATLIILATTCYGLNVNLIKKHLSDINPVAITVGNFTVLLFPAVLILIFSGFFQNIDQVPVQHATFFIAILGVVGTGIANILFFKLIQISSPVFATSVTYLIPVVAFCWGFLDGESLSWPQVFGAFVILIGVYLSSKK